MEESCEGQDEHGQADKDRCAAPTLNTCGVCGPEPPGVGAPCPPLGDDHFHNDETCAMVCQVGTEELTCGPLVPSEELCNGLDDDCDDRVDEPGPGGEAPGLGVECTLLGELGLCAKGTVRDCDEGRPVCVSDLASVAEECNGLDDDCDGRIDEGGPGGGGACDIEGLQGPCAIGINVCVDGVLTCQQTTDPSVEVCDGVDNDCDGVPDIDEDDLRDEAFDCELTQGVCAVGPGQPRPKKLCVEGRWVGCDVPGFELPEQTCDGRDNDCDGRTDARLSPPLAARQAGVCAGQRSRCGGMAGWVEPDYGLVRGFEAPEVCCVGLDNDCNGVVDDTGAGCPLLAGCSVLCRATGQGNHIQYVVCAAAGHGRRWADAEAVCARRAFSGHLVQINGRQENEYVWRELPPGVASVWSGLRQTQPPGDQGQEAGWAWSNGSPLGAWQNWGGGQPDDGGHDDREDNREDCAELWAPAGAWNDLSCGLLRPFVCERPAPAGHQCR